MHRTFKKKAGMTIVELMTSILLVSILLGAVWAVYNVGFKVVHGQTARGGITTETERTLFTLGSDLRQASSVTAAAQTSITFTADTDSSGVNEAIQYTWDGTSGNPLNRIASVTMPMINSVSSLAFSYYDADNDLLSFPVTASQVQRVMVDMTVASADESFTVRASTDLRCL